MNLHGISEFPQLGDALKKLLLGPLAVVVGLFMFLGISQLIASESGEVVVLTTLDAEGGSHETRVWIVEHEGHSWLRAGAEVQEWYQRLAAKPEIELLRGEKTVSYNAVPVPEKRDVINSLMLDKYRWADEYIGVLFGRDDAVPIRLEAR